MDKHLERVIFSYLDIQDFVQIERGRNIYFVNSENDKYAQIRYDKEDGHCFININLIREISSYFSLQESDSKQVIGKWVENTLPIKVTNTIAKLILSLFAVENTLPIKVTNTYGAWLARLL